MGLMLYRRAMTLHIEKWPISQAGHAARQWPIYLHSTVWRKRPCTAVYVTPADRVIMKMIRLGDRLGQSRPKALEYPTP